MTITLPERRNRHPFFICRGHSIQTCRRCGRWIIHVFLIRWIFRVAPPVLGFSVGVPTLFGPPIAALRFPAGCPAGTQPAGITAIGLSPPATPADAKANLAPTTENKNKLQKIPTLKSAGERSRIKKVVPSFRTHAEVHPKSPKWPFRAFPVCKCLRYYCPSLLWNCRVQGWDFQIL
jgi:hypothetical protein